MNKHNKIVVTLLGIILTLGCAVGILLSRDAIREEKFLRQYRKEVDKNKIMRRLPNRKYIRIK